MKALWIQFCTEYRLSPHEQTCLNVEGLAEKVTQGSPMEALARLARLRTPSHGPSAHEAPGHPKRAAQAVPGGTEAEWQGARLLARLSAQRAEADPSVQEMRRYILGRTEPLSRAMAWAMLKSLSKSDAPGRHFTFPGPDGREHTAHIGDDAPGGLRWLSVFAETVGRLFRWSEDDAAWFLLTGAAPRLAPVMLRIETASEIEEVDGVRVPCGKHRLGGMFRLDVLPSVSGESVAATVETAKRRLFETRRGPLPVGRLAMLEFVKGEMARSGGRRLWAEWYGRWKSEAPREWHPADEQAMRRACSHEGLAPGMKGRKRRQQGRAARARAR